MIDPRSGIWSLKEAAQSHFFDEPLAAAITTLITPADTADLGCGKGYYCRYFSEIARWPNVDGFEGTPNIKQLAVYKNIQQLDLSRPLVLTKRYSFVMCLEVAEHIPAKRESVLIDNWCKLAAKDLLISWAVPGQAGVGHVNCRTNNYVVEKITSCGFALNLANTQLLRDAATLPWFKHTTLYFNRR